MSDLKPQQLLMLDYLREHKECILNVGMGLGKTRAILELIAEMVITGESRGVLIVAPNLVSTLTWPDEIEKWTHLSWLKYSLLRERSGMEDWHAGRSDIYLINYERLVRFDKTVLSKMKELPVDTLILDELTKVKNPSSKNGNAIRKHRLKFKRHIGLTGTLLSNGLLQVFAQARIIDGGKALGTAYRTFRSRWFDGDYMGFTYTPKPTAEKEITDRLGVFTLTLESKDWLTIPESRVDDVEVTLPAATMKKYRELEHKMYLEIKEKGIEAVNAGVLVNKLQQFTSGASYYDETRDVVEIHPYKLEACKKLVEEADTPVIIAVAYVHEVDRLIREMPNAVKFKRELMPEWNAGNLPCVIAHPASFGHGLNMQGPCRHLIWFSLTPDRDAYEQTNARIVRTGQTRQTIIHRLITKDTVDYHVAAILRRKTGESDSFNAVLKSIAASG